MAHESSRGRARGGHKIVVVGPGPGSRGGISAVLQSYMQMPFWKRHECRWIATTSGRPGRGAKTAAFFRGFGRALVLIRRDTLVHVHTASCNSFLRKAAFMWLSRLVGGRLIVHVHGGAFLSFVDGAGPLMRRLILSTLRLSDCIVALSAPAAEGLRSLLPGTRVLVVPNPYSPLGEQAGPAAGGGPTILFAGRIEDAKGAYDLLRAFVRVRREVPECRLVMAGDGDIDRAKALAKSLEIETAVEFPGWLTGPRLEAEFARSTLFCLPSYCEALPTALLRAMASGVPVLATTVGGVPEYIESGRTGLLVAPGDIEGLSTEAVRLLSDPELRARLAAAAKLRVEPASSYRVGQTLERIYQSVIDGRRDPLE